MPGYKDDETNPPDPKRRKADAPVAMTGGPSAPVVIPVPAPATPASPFQVTCLYIAQGDCIFIKCPDGKNVLIDCGNTAGINDKKNTLNDEGERNLSNKELFFKGLKQLTGGKDIDHLIITHSDADHHNQFYLLGRDAKKKLRPDLIKVKEVIIGNLQWYDFYYNIEKHDVAASNDSEKAGLKNEYKKAVENDSIPQKEYWEYWQEKYSSNRHYALDVLNRDCGCANFTGLTLNKNKKVVKKISVESKEGKFMAVDPNVSRVAEQDGYYTVCEDSASPKRWSIKIIAAEVESEEADSGAYMNTASLVTLLEIDGRKALFTGDSTGTTFRYLIGDQSGDMPMSADAPLAVRNFFPAPVLGNGFDLVQVPHHGSASFESNYKDFINCTRPRYLFTSVKFDENKHILPKWASVGKWKRLGNSTLEVTSSKDHYIGYWITREELQTKRIGKEVDSDQKNKGDDYLTSEEVKLFLQKLKLKPHSSNEDFRLYALKKDSLNPDRKYTLFVLNRREAPFRETGGAKQKTEIFFVIQKTKKAIATNGVNVISDWLQNIIDSAVSSATDLEDGISVQSKDLVEQAFNNLGRTRYLLSNEGAKIVTESSVDKKRKRE